MGRLGIRWLLLGTNGIVLLVPIVALLALRIYDTYLVRQTERQLIAQGVLIGEALRDAWLAETGRGSGHGIGTGIRPPRRAAQRYVPIEPRTDLRSGIRPSYRPPTRRRTPRDTPLQRAATRTEPLLRRAQVFNLSAVRILDSDGCVLATTRGEEGLCLAGLAEVDGARAGRYSAVLRERHSDEPRPPLGDVRRRGRVRIFSAVPIFADGELLAIVRLSRTSLDAFSSLWRNRRGLVLLGAATALVTIVLSFVFATAIIRPLRRITVGAGAVARGEPVEDLAAGTWAPSEVHQLGASLTTMARQLRQRAEAVAEFASNVSHELKTPLTGVRGAAELLRDGWPTMAAPQRERFIANIEADAARMERLVTRLLHLARVESRRDETQQLDPRAVVAGLCERYQPEHAIAWRASPRTPAHIQINPDHFTTAVGNLIDNAVRHGRGAPIQIDIDVPTEPSGGDDHLQIRVTDHGPGISAANQERIFERFFTTDRDHGGTGLGLAIARAVAHSRNGSLRFTSRPGETTFVLVL